MQNRRAHFRKDVQTDAWIADPVGDEWSRATLLDISTGGLAFIGDGQLASDALRMFRFYLPGNPKRLQVTVKIMNCAKHAFLNGFRIGTEFVRLNEQDAAAIQQFVDTH